MFLDWFRTKAKPTVLTPTADGLFFTKDMVSWRAEVWRDELSSFRSQAQVRYLEIGTFEGRSLIWMFNEVLHHPTSHAVVIDPFYDGTRELFLKNICTAGIASRVELIDGYSEFELRKLPLDSFDIVYVDGSHHAKNVLIDATSSWLLLRRGGVLIFDDYGLEMFKDAPHLNPKLAIDAFLQAFQDDLEILEMSHEVIVRKV